MQFISGRFVTHDQDFHGTVYYKNGLITSIEKSLQPGHYSDDCVIFPGFGDVHIHAREDVSGKHVYKEDFVSAGNAAVNGGVTHLADMPNNPVPPVDDNSYDAKQKLTEKSPIHITLYAGIGPGTSPLERNVPYKVYMGPSVGDLFFESLESLEKTISRYRGQSVSFHCEDPETLLLNKTRELHEDRRPPQAEKIATDFAIYLIEKYELKGKLCHFSTGDGLNKIREARKKGINVLCEATPTHLYFHTGMLNDTNRDWLQMNPPVRPEVDRDALLQALIDGTVDFLATDHAPHTPEEKHKKTSGIPHLDTYGLFVCHLINEQNVPLSVIARICSLNPGIFVNPYLPKQYGKGFGRIAPGFAANFTVLNLREKTTVTTDMLKTKCAWSPFAGVTFPGKVESVVFAGRQLC